MTRQVTTARTMRRQAKTGRMGGEVVMRRACNDGEDKEEAGKDGADEEEADDCGNEEEMQTEAEGIVAWHRRRQCVRRRERWPLF